MLPHSRKLTRIRPVICLGVLLLAACAGPVKADPSPAGTPAPQPSPTVFPTQVSPTEIPPTATLVPVIPTPTSTPAPTALANEPVCQDDWCVYPGHFWLQRPIAGALGDGIDPSYRYGDDQNGTREPHSGVEFPAEYGNDVLAAADGQVVVAGDDKTESYSQRTGFYGNLVILEHHFAGYAEPVYSLYAHLSEVGVTVGQTVMAGERLGAVGATGWANGPHLHFEVRVGSLEFDSTRNPELWVIPHTGPVGVQNGAVAGKLISMDGFELEVETIDLAPVGEGGGQTVYLKPYTGKYIHSDDVWAENFALSDIPAGSYEWSFVARGQLWKGVIPVEPGKVTVFQVIVR